MMKATALAAIALLLFAAESAALERRKCVAVLDGDTVIFENGERGRLIGVDAPEVAHGDKPAEKGGVEAKAYLEKLVKGREVSVDYDWERTDRYGRTLCYLYAPDGTLVNLALIERGYARAMRFFDYREKERFLRAQKENAR